MRETASTRRAPPEKSKVSCFFAACLLSTTMPTIDIIFENIRSQQENSTSSRPTIGAGHRKVLVRDKNWFITELPQKSKIDYERRQRYRDAGPQAFGYLPYKTFGSLKADVYDILEDYLKININRNPTFTGICGYSNRLNEQTDDSAGGDHNVIIVYDVLSKRHKPLPRSSVAGLDIISKHLGAYQRMLQNVKAHSSIKQTLNRELQRQDVLQEIKAPKIIVQNGQRLAINKPFVYLPPIMPTASSKICLVEDPPQAMLHPGAGEGEKNEPSSSVLTMFRPRTKYEEEDLHLAQREFQAKIKSIYAILCCLHNIRNKELRSFNTLPFATIKTRCKHPPYISQQHQLRYFLPFLRHHHYHHQNQQLLDLSTTSRLDTRTKQQRLAIWEDILDLHHSEDTCYNKQRRSLPAWKKKVIIVEDKTSLKQDPAKRLAHIVNSFQQFKNEAAQEVKTVLKDKELIRDRTLALKSKHFVCGSTLEKTLHEMRVKTYQDLWAERREQDVDKPEWFGLLEDEIEKLFCHQVDVVLATAALESLKPFMFINTNDLPHVIEKLTLLVMSLPAHYLCIKQVLLAFEFVCEMILKTSPKIINKLKEMRKLPLFDDLQPPDFLFGMRVFAHH